MCFVFFKQKTAYEMRISDWSSDVCSADRRMAPRRRIGSTIAGKTTNGTNWGSQKAILVKIAPAAYSPLSCSVRTRSEESRVGKECVDTCKSRWSSYH